MWVARAVGGRSYNQLVERVIELATAAEEEEYGEKGKQQLQVKS